jgi:hypothetical protein
MLRSFLLYAGLLLSLTVSVQAASIHVGFVGTWGTADVGHVSGVSAGDPFTTSLFYNDAGLIGSGTEFGAFESFSIVTGLVNATFLPGDFAEAKVRLQDGVLDYFEFRDDLGLVAGCQFCSFYFFTDGIPEFEFRNGPPGTTVFETDSTTFVITSPEPGTWALLASGGVLIFLKRRRGRS